MRVLGSARRWLVVAIVTGGLVVGATASWADPGDPDPSWSGDGLAQDALGVEVGGVRILVLPNGKVIVAGEIDEGGPTGKDVFLARYTAGGVLDGSFSGDGYRSIELSDTIDSPWALARQSNGRYVLGGYIYSDPGKVFVMRTLANGDLDTTFSGDGVATPNLPGYDGGFVWKLLIQPDGKIVAVGEAYPSGGGTDLMVLRFRTNGTLDPSFNGDGRLLKDVAGGEDTAWHAQLLANGKILGIGTANTATDGARVAVWRINANGFLDQSFSGDGLAIFNLHPTAPEYGRAIFKRSDGKYVALAQANDFDGAGTEDEFAVLRINPNGTLDTTFGGGDGKVFTGAGAMATSYYDVVRRSNGRLVVAGTADGDFAVWQLMANGALDLGFGDVGMVIFDPEGGRANGIALSGSKVVAAGEIGDDVAVVRLLNS